MRYIVSADWVEVYARLDSLFPEWMSCDKYFAGEYKARRRAYGTRVYQFVYDVTKNETPLMTITCMPLSRRSQGGIMNDDMCHVKIENYWLYRDDWYQVFTHALRSFRINPIRLSRVDIACDWQHGECGLYAGDLLAGLMKRKYLKIHQPSWRANGTDAAKMSWHSLAFGSKNSPVFTRFYNKTLELQTSGKEYIREGWKNAGMNLQRDVYRTEFQLSDTGREVIDQETGEQFDITLEQVADRRELAFLFFHYAQHYFDIRKANTATKRTNCTPLQIFPTSPLPFQPVQRPRCIKSNRTDKLVCRRMIESMFMIPDINARRHMFIALGRYVWARHSGVLCTGALRLLRDALGSDNIPVSSLIDEMFEMTREHYTKYDSYGVWLYEIWNDCRDEGWMSQLEIEPTKDAIDEDNLTNTLFDTRPK